MRKLHATVIMAMVAIFVSGCAGFVRSEIAVFHKLDTFPKGMQYSFFL